MPGAIKVPDFVPQPLLKQHDAAVLDLAFVIDCTSSMGSWINEAKENIHNIVDEIVAKEMSDIRLALVEYRDHPPQDSTFVTRVLDFTPSLKDMQKQMDSMAAHGGGDGPEAVADGLHETFNLNWRPLATKVCVLIADAPPHGLGDSGDGFPKGCPAGHDPMKIARQMAEQNITLYSVVCGSYAEGFKDFFMAIAHVTGGQYVSLKDAKLLSKVIIGGAREEMSLQQLLEEVNHEVINEYHASGGRVDEDAMADRVEKTLAKRKRTAKTMAIGTSEEPSERSKRIAEFESMSDVKRELAKPEIKTGTTAVTSRMKRKRDDSEPTTTVSTVRSKKRALMPVISRRRRHVSDDDACVQTRASSTCPVTGVCAVCNPSSSPRSCCSGRKSPTLLMTSPVVKRSPKKTVVLAPTTATSTPAISITYPSDIKVHEGKSVSKTQVRRLVKKSIAVNKLRKS
ncbi:uncharacterized protein LOC100367364 [Saccoglossus kowalevskii]|uniref:Uncharacterized protein LOC100367364 n=1 Tax=Saccoglossus kowalevskii TaxID=10224 RepID=A0ABM0GQB4_SACKO|nr:PREDICTED: uncharacterized protein LOC100367364 [Saccoglossus kowalevskii]